jgi:hypothetical protein
MTGPFHSDAFENRRLGLEEEYFRSRDSELVGKLKKVFHCPMSAEAFKAAGVKDDAVVERLLKANLRGEMLVAFKLYPLVEIAWADGGVDAAERKAVVDAAVSSGVPRDAETIKRLEEWLARGPNEDMRAVWKMYAGELKKSLSAAELATFRHDLQVYAKRVAEASGGIMGMAWQISASEQKVLNELAALLSG